MKRLSLCCHAPPLLSVAPPCRPRLRIRRPKKIKRNTSSITLSSRIVDSFSLLRRQTGSSAYSHELMLRSCDGNKAELSLSIPV